jgi:eukaryotic-like serine/threonine-protein kinase
VSALLADRYALGRELGSGGMARVVAAHDQLLDREVAVKLLSAPSDGAARTRFLQEARSAARLSHPDAVSVFDTGEHEGQPFIVMELIDGETLGDLLDREGPLEVEVAVAITLGVLDVLAAAHRQGMVHRDVKPGNVLLPAEGGVKLADFGIAKAMDEVSAGLTATGSVVGTASYLAPELVEGGRATPASDVYSVGCMLYALLAGRPPFTGDSALAVAYAQRHTPVPAVETLRPEVPAELRAVLDRALAKDPSVRYPDAEGMRAALLDGEVDAPATVPLAAAAPEREPTAVLAPAGAGGPRPEARRGLAGSILGLLAVALVLGVLAWWIAGALGGQDEPAVAPADEGAAEAPEDEGAAAEEGGTGEEAAPEEETPAEETPAEEAPAEEATDPEEGEPEDQAAEPPSGEMDLDGLIAALVAAPSGSYGEKHDDLLEDLVDLSREDDPATRAEEAEAVRVALVDWVEDGEFDPEMGAVALQVLEREAARA